MASRIHPFLTNGRQSDQSIWETVQSAAGLLGGGSHQVGTRAALEDGRVFYYARSQGAAIVAGNLLTAELQTDEFTDMATGSGVVSGDLTVTPTTKATAVTENEYAGGYAIVNDDTGEGITYTIASHPLAASTSTCVLTLDDPIQVDWGAGTTISMHKPVWADVIIAPAGAAHIAAGVANVAVIAGTTNPQYFWCQTWGMASVTADEAVTIGQLVGSGPDTAGQVGFNNGTVEQIVGINGGHTMVAGEFNAVFLTIAP